MKNFCSAPSKPIKAIKNITKIRHKAATTAAEKQVWESGNNWRALETRKNFILAVPSKYTKLNFNLQRSAHTGALTDSSYVQLLHEGIAAIDMGFPCRYTHSANEVCDPKDLAALTELLVAGILAIDKSFTLDRDHHTK